MLQEIIVNTPLWVWALLAFLVYRGLAARRDQEIPLAKVFIIPIVMLGLALYGIATTFGTDAIAVLIWCAATAASAWASWHWFRTENVAARPERGAVFQRGSWMPLTLMMGVFFTKYVVEVLIALDPSHLQDEVFDGAVCALFGVFSGIFIGRTLRIFSIYRQARSQTAMAGADAA